MSRVKRRFSLTGRRPLASVLTAAGVFALMSAPLALCANIAAPVSKPKPLRRVSPPHGGYSLLLPSDWRFRDASYPSDHFTHLWWEPGNPLKKAIVVGSGCVGCVSKNLSPRIPNPYGELPDGVVHTYRISPWKLAYTAYTTDDPYPDNGLIIVLANRGRVSGSLRIDVWLPQSQHQLATAMLNSVRVVG